MAQVPEIGDAAPDFTLQSTKGDVSLDGLLNEGRVVLAFYQEDLSPT